MWHHIVGVSFHSCPGLQMLIESLYDWHVHDGGSFQANLLFMGSDHMRWYSSPCFLQIHIHLHYLGPCFHTVKCLNIYFLITSKVKAPWDESHVRWVVITSKLKFLYLIFVKLNQVNMSLHSIYHKKWCVLFIDFHNNQAYNSNIGTNVWYEFTTCSIQIYDAMTTVLH